jgi:hypothetical protein
MRRAVLKSTGSTAVPASVRDVALSAISTAATFVARILGDARDSIR